MLDRYKKDDEDRKVFIIFFLYEQEKTLPKKKIAFATQTVSDSVTNCVRDLLFT